MGMAPTRAAYRVLWHSKPDKIGKLEYMVKLVADI